MTDKQLMTKTIDVCILGITLGTATGWDDAGDWSIIFYDFVTDESLNLPKGDLFVNFTTGTVEICDNYADNDDSIVYKGNAVNLIMSKVLLEKVND